MYLMFHMLGKQAALADLFVEFAQQDETLAADKDAPVQEAQLQEKPLHWSNSTPVEGGDAGTRNYNLGLPAYKGV